jgi:hypothetical protein
VDENTINNALSELIEYLTEGLGSTAFDDEADGSKGKGKERDAGSDSDSDTGKGKGKGRGGKGKGKGKGRSAGKRAAGANDGDSDGDGDSEDELRVVGASTTVLCPLTKTTFVDPVKGACGHVFTRTSLLSLMGRKASIVCPIGGCRRNIAAADLVEDTETVLRLESALGPVAKKRRVRDLSMG